MYFLTGEAAVSDVIPLPATIAQDIRIVSTIDAVPAILDVICRITGMRFAAVARVTETKWTVCAVRDGIDFGLEPGGELELETTICNEIRSSRTGVVISHVEEDAAFRDHATPRQYGFQSYISVPITRTDGSFFGTLCAIDPLPAKLDASIRTTFELFAELIAFHLDQAEAAARSEAALLDAQQTAELREQFIAVLAHDLRNPVAAIDAGTRLLSDASLDDRAQRIVTLMQASSRRMALLINDVLDFARGRLGGGLSIAAVTDNGLGQALAQVIDEVRVAFPERVILSSVAIAEPVQCEPARLSQLLSNLLANAVSHGSSESAITIEATCHAGEFRLVVANGGAPIRAEKIAKLFLPFTRAEEGKSTQGLGLGLYIAAEIAKAHGGRIDVSSDDDGTRFTFVMPAVPVGPRGIDAGDRSKGDAAGAPPLSL